MASAVRATISLLAGSATSAIGAKNLFETCSKNCATCANFGACHQGFDMNMDFDFGGSKSHTKTGADYSQAFSGNVNSGSGVNGARGYHFNSLQESAGFNIATVNSGQTEVQNKDNLKEKRDLKLPNCGKSKSNDKLGGNTFGGSVKINSHGMVDPSINFGYSSYGNSKV